MTLTVDDLQRLEPRLRVLAAAIAQRPYAPWWRAWYGPHGFKSQLRSLVGASRAADGNDTLASSLAYELAYDWLLGLLRARDK